MSVGFSEPKQLTLRKSKRLVEGLVYIPLLSHIRVFAGRMAERSRCAEKCAPDRDSE